MPPPGGGVGSRLAGGVHGADRGFRSVPLTVDLSWVPSGTFVRELHPASGMARAKMTKTRGKIRTITTNHGQSRRFAVGAVQHATPRTPHTNFFEAKVRLVSIVVVKPRSSKFLPGFRWV